MDRCKINDISLVDGNGAAINGVIKNDYELKVKDCTFNKCIVIGSGYMGGGVFAVVENGGKLVIDGKKGDSEFTFVGCVADFGGALAVSFKDDANIDNGLLLDGMILLSFIIYKIYFFFLCLLFINRFSFI
jgi:hypothetical protein